MATAWSLSFGSGQNESSLRHGALAVYEKAGDMREKWATHRLLVYYYDKQPLIQGPVNQRS